MIKVPESPVSLKAKLYGKEEYMGIEGLEEVIVSAAVYAEKYKYGITPMKKHDTGSAVIFVTALTHSFVEISANKRITMLVFISFTNMISVQTSNSAEVNDVEIFLTFLILYIRIPRAKPLQIFHYSSAKRIRKELAEITFDPPPNRSAGPKRDSTYEQRLTILGPSGPVYECGIFFLNITCSSSYSFKLPNVTFHTTIYHCNINSQGVICLARVLLYYFKDFVVNLFPLTLTDCNSVDPPAPGRGGGAADGPDRGPTPASANAQGSRGALRAALFRKAKDKGTGARLPVCGHLGRNVPGAPLHRGHLAASAAATRQPKSPFCTIPKSEKTTPPGPYHDDFKSRHRAPLQLQPEVPEVSESLTGNRGGGPKRASGRTNLSVWRARSPLGTAGLSSLHRRLGRVEGACGDVDEDAARALMDVLLCEVIDGLARDVVERRRSLPVVPPMNTSSLEGSSIQEVLHDELVDAIEREPLLGALPDGHHDERVVAERRLLPVRFGPVQGGGRGRRRRRRREQQLLGALVVVGGRGAPCRGRRRRRLLLWRRRRRLRGGRRRVVVVVVVVVVVLGVVAVVVAVARVSSGGNGGGGGAGAGQRRGGRRRPLGAERGAGCAGGGGGGTERFGSSAVGPQAPALASHTFAHALGDSVPFSPRRSSFSSASNPNWKRVAASYHPGNVFILLVDIGGKIRFLNFPAPIPIPIFISVFITYPNLYLQISLCVREKKQPLDLKAAMEMERLSVKASWYSGRNVTQQIKKNSESSHQPIRRQQRNELKGGSVEGVVSKAPFQAISELLKVGDPVEMDEGGCHLQDVEDLMRLEPYVEFSRQEALRNPRGIKASSGDVRHSHEEEPAHLARRGGLDEALRDCKVHGGHGAAQAKPQEHPCSCLLVLRTGKLVPLGHSDGRDARTQTLESKLYLEGCQ
ncbi:hypothetical protein EI555_010717 [Monodon monoceros]|uniref:UBC core domain-containing protein n=1 Tax=Monodon monoceros TaxID=40151 RepID=A0A4U1ELX5_MONMO|nr:hypothetical protein EI555_010717 [Monodon monoceros]